MKQRYVHSAVLLTVFVLGGVITPPLHWLSHALHHHDIAPITHADGPALADGDAGTLALDCELCGLLAKTAYSETEGGFSAASLSPTDSLNPLVATTPHTSFVTALKSRAPPSKV